MPSTPMAASASNPTLGVGGSGFFVRARTVGFDCRSRVRQIHRYPRRLRLEKTKSFPSSRHCPEKVTQLVAVRLLEVGCVLHTFLCTVIGVGHCTANLTSENWPDIQENGQFLKDWHRHQIAKDPKPLDP
jgi:hypothetical protein